MFSFSVIYDLVYIYLHDRWPMGVTGRIQKTSAGPVRSFDLRIINMQLRVARYFTSLLHWRSGK